MVTHSSTLAWKISWTEEPDRLQSWGHQESDMTERLQVQCQCQWIDRHRETILREVVVLYSAAIKPHLDSLL